MGAFSVSHWLIVLLVVLLLFGPKKISEMGKGLGQGLRNFRSGLSEDDQPERMAKSGGETASRANDIEAKN